MIPRNATRIASALLFAATVTGTAGTAQNAAVTQTSAPALRLSEALREATQHAFPNRLAAATNAEERAKARLPWKGLLPSARIEAGIVRTTDPIGAFGTTLRQGIVTQAAFDPARLNNPDAITNASGGLVLEVPLLNTDAILGLRAARAGVSANDAMREWTVMGTHLDVVRAYFGGTLAAEKAVALESAKAAADAMLREVQALVRQGLVTKADALQAEVRTTDVTSQLFAAQNDRLNAEQSFAVVLGRSGQSGVPLPTTLPAASRIRALAARDTAARAPDAPAGAPDETEVLERSDIRAARAGVQAASADRSRATATLLPRVNGFARSDWNAAHVPFDGQRNWTVGIVASWSLFSGGNELADRNAAAARAQRAHSALDASVAASGLESTSARRGIVLQLQRLDLAERARDASREAERIVQKRYVGGLATIAELLGAQSAATNAELGEAAARYALIDAIATYRRATGADPATLSELDDAQ